MRSLLQSNTARASSLLRIKGDRPHFQRDPPGGDRGTGAVRLLACLLASSLLVPSPSLASSIEVVPKQGDSKKPKRPREPSPNQTPAPNTPPTPRPQPSAVEAASILRAETPPPPQPIELKPLPLIGIGAAVAAGAVGTGLLIGASNELDRDNFTFDAEERADGTIDVDITDDFRDAQRAVILKGFGGTFLVSVSATLLTVSLLELFQKPAR
ncbi:MAG: hypothetical protein AAGJ19_07990 [Myxococcota bacterium]